MKTKLAIGVLAVVLVVLGLRSYWRITEFAADAGIVLSENRTLQWAAALALLIVCTGVFLLIGCGISYMGSRKRKG